MIFLQVPIMDNGNEIKKTEAVYDISEIPFNELMHRKQVYKGHGERRVSYPNIVCAFDIETTNVDCEEPYAFMYHWQFCIDKYVIFGRRWESFLELLDTLRARLALTMSRRMVIYVHNLQFEFQFMREFMQVDSESSFFRAPRRPLKVVIDGFEFRDSYALSNMTLAKFCENSAGVQHYKLTDTYDYRKLRTPETELSMEELAYCYNDVRGLCECIEYRLRDDTLASIPLTSTGYVRRDFRKSMQENPENRKMFKFSRLTPELYTMMKAAFRGGDTHANIFHVRDVLTDIDSFDIASSYPAQEMYCKYPMGAFFKLSPEKIKTIDREKYCYICEIYITDCKYIGKCGNPYIPVSKSKTDRNKRIVDNGRILYAPALQMTVTDVDLDIIRAEYSGKIMIRNLYAARKDYLPTEFKRVLMEYYKRKTEWKGIGEKYYEYMKAKNCLNASYGCCVMDIGKGILKYVDGEYKTETDDLETILDGYYKNRNSFLPYQWGVWITAYARKQLRDMLQAVGNTNVYDDTDSIKCYQGNREKFDATNAEIIKRAETMGAYAIDSKGKKRYLGIWEYEGCYKKFKTLGAKKYLYEDESGIHSTIAGVSKKAGAEFFTEHGFVSFDDGTVIEESGHLVAHYNDCSIHSITVNGCTFTTAANTALIDGTYTVGLTAEYLDLLEKALENEELIL